MPSRSSVEFEHVEPFVGDAQVIEDLHHLAGKSALRELRRALHEQHHVVTLHFIVDELLDAHEISVLFGGDAASLPIYVAQIPAPAQVGEIP